MTQVELDPVAIRKALVIHRRKGTQWELAWLDATNHHRATADYRSVYGFMHAQFRAAYFNDQSGSGRCLVPERDVSGAVSSTGAVARPAPSLDHEHCRSGGGCDRTATRGRFGKTFCDYHADELERIRVTSFSGGGLGNGRSPVARCG